jgi:hypothetical protein
MWWSFWWTAWHQKLILLQHRDHRYEWSVLLLNEINYSAFSGLMRHTRPSIQAHDISEHRMLGLSSCRTKALDAPGDIRESWSVPSVHSLHSKFLSRQYSSKRQTCERMRITQIKKNLYGLSPRANYTDRATAACRRSDCQLLRIEGATWSAWRIPTAVF